MPRTGVLKTGVVQLEDELTYRAEREPLRWAAKERVTLSALLVREKLSWRSVAGLTTTRGTDRPQQFFSNFRLSRENASGLPVRFSDYA